MKNSVGIIPIFVSHMGCPNDCSFCNQRKINGVDEAIHPEALFEFVQSYLKTMKRDQIELAFFGGSFTGIETTRQIAYLEKAEALKSLGLIHKIRLSTRPDYIDEAIINRLKKYTVDLVELGCQSFDNTVLTATQRGHDVRAIVRAVDLLKEAKIDFGIQLMLGLPEDDYEKFMDSVAQTTALQPSCVRLYPALVIRDTQMEKDYLAGNYKPLTLDESVLWTANAFRIFHKNNIPVIRMGLQRTDLIDFDASVIAGPFHPAFGEMVMSFIFFETIDAMLVNLSQLQTSIEIHVNPKQISAAIGNKRQNQMKIRDKYYYLYSNYLTKTHERFEFVADSQVAMNQVVIYTSNERFEEIIMK